MLTPEGHAAAVELAKSLSEEHATNITIGVAISMAVTRMLTDAPTVSTRMPHVQEPIARAEPMTRKRPSAAAYRQG